MKRKQAPWGRGPVHPGTTWLTICCACVVLGVRPASAQRGTDRGSKSSTKSGADAARVKGADSPLIAGCNDCELLHISGEVYEPAEGGVASPVGTTYSVTHKVAGDPDGGGPLGVTCVLINHPANPGAPDDIVTFNNIPEAIRTDIFMTVPTVSESDTSQPNGRRTIVINTSSPTGTNLFPGGALSGQCAADRRVLHRGPG